MPPDQEVCPAENEQQSEHSPGVIEDEERLVKVIHSPEHYDQEKGTIKPGAFSAEDLHNLNRGLSLDRILHSSRESLQERAETLTGKKKERLLEGFATTIAEKIRQITHSDGERALCVIDDGLKENPAHSICIRAGDQTKSKMRGIRGKLMDVFDLGSLDDLFK